MRSPSFVFGHSNSELEKISTLDSPYNMKPSILLRIFILLVKKCLDKTASIFSSGSFFLVAPFALQNSILFRDYTLKFLEM